MQNIVFIFKLIEYFCGALFYLFFIYLSGCAFDGSHIISYVLQVCQRMGTGKFFYRLVQNIDKVHLYISD